MLKPLLFSVALVLACGGPPPIVGTFRGEASSFVACTGAAPTTTTAPYAATVTQNADGFLVENASDPCAPYFLNRDFTVRAAQCVDFDTGAASFDESTDKLHLNFTLTRGQCHTAFSATLTRDFQ